MKNETKHLLHWWKEWLVRLLTTSYHLVNRKAYHQYLQNKPKRKSFMCPIDDDPDFEEYMEQNPEEFH